MQARSPREATPDNNSIEIYIVIAIALVIIVVGTYLYNNNDKSNQPPAPQKLPIIVQTDPAAPGVADPSNNEGEVQLTTSVNANDNAKTGSTDIMEDSATTKPLKTTVTTSNMDADSVTDKNTDTLLLDTAKEVIKPEQSSVQPLKPTVAPLPNLDSSDPVAFTTAQQLSWLPAYATLLINKEIIRNFVVFIDNLSRGDLVTKFSPLERPKEKFMVQEQAQEIYLDQQGYARYNLYVDIINSIDIEFATNQYMTLKPLFNTAYQELGYPNGSFEDTLYQAIEVLLAAPVIREPIRLVAPSAMYKFADPSLETLPAAHKLMIRMGPDNQIKLQPKLQQIQLALENIAQ